MTTTTRETGPTDPVRSVMTRVVATVPPWQSLRDVARELAADEVSSVLVVDGRRTLGLISERDVVGAAAAGQSLDEAQAADVMTAELVWADPEDTILETAELMLDVGVRHLPVGDGERLIGVVSARDVLDVLLTSERSRTAAAEGGAGGAPVVHFEIGAADGERSRRFYSELFGWGVDVDERTGYGVVRTGSEVGIAGGIASSPPGVPSWVTFYVAVPDLDAALARAGVLGGRTVVAPTEIGPGMAFAMFADPEGNIIGLFRE
jgi:predicted enzyme related to lactoylglutathione lyase/CBS domain-containing protein